MDWLVRTARSALTLACHAGLCLLVLLGANDSSLAQEKECGPTMLDPELDVRTVAGGLDLPITMAFIGNNDFLVLQKNTGQVLRVKDGAVQGPVLDLAVNSNSERGLLGIALHPDFPGDPRVYLYWTCRSTTPQDADPFTPEERECSNDNMFGEDTEDILAVPLIGNRVDSFVWNGTTLEFDQHLSATLTFQNDAAPTPAGQGDQDQPARANHNGGVLRFGPDGKLYVLIGDAGRRGQMQNLASGPTRTGGGAVMQDDQFGGPEPDDAHFTGVILRLDDDGSAPRDNPFYALGARMGGEAGTNLQKVFAYGIRNSFGMDFDPVGGNLWAQENGEDAFDELNLVEPGMNGGWIQIAGPLSRIADYRGIETTSLENEDVPSLQQLRWSPENIARSQRGLLSRLFMLPGAHYSDPELSWKYVIAPAAIGFVSKRGLGGGYFGDLFMGVAEPEPLGGVLLHFELSRNRKGIAVNDRRLDDQVVDNRTFHGLTQGETLLIGHGFGIVTDIRTAPNGNLFVVSLSNNAVYEVFRKPEEEED